MERHQSTMTKEPCIQGREKLSEEVPGPARTARGCCRATSTCLQVYGLHCADELHVARGFSNHPDPEHLVN